MRALLLVGLVFAVPQVSPEGAQLASALRQVVAAPSHPGMRWGDIGDVRATLTTVYSTQGWRPLWLENGVLSPAGDRIIAAIAGAAVRGLDPADYDADRLAHDARAMLRFGIRERASFDVALSTAAIRFTLALHNGRIDPRRWYPFLQRGPDSLNIGATLRALSSSVNLDSLWESMQPRHPEYWRLLRLLARFQALARDPPALKLPDLHTPLRPGASLPDASRLRALLVTLGELPDTMPPGDDTTYDASLAKAVIRFQAHQALTRDGIIGTATRARLLQPMRDRARQIELTLEQWRWLPLPVGIRVISINIPAFHLRASDPGAGAGDSGIEMDVIIGRRPDKPTPILTTTATGIQFWPPWIVPPPIARTEILPQILRDSTLLAREGFELLRGNSVVPATSENVRRIGTGIDLRQRPGPANPLGHLKLVMTNPANIYLHDTPSRRLFEAPERTFSHGCIRLADAAGLARLLLALDTNRTRIPWAEAFASDTTLVIPLAQPMPVIVVYHTVEVNERGVPTFYPDVYGRNAALDSALHKGYPFFGTVGPPARRITPLGESCR